MVLRIQKCNTVRIKTIGILLLLIPLIPIEGLYYLNNPLYNVLFVYCSFLDAIFIIYLWVNKYLHNHRINKASFYFYIMAVYNIVLTVVLHGDVRRSIGVWVYSVPTIMLADICEHDMDRLLKTILVYLEALIVVDFVLILLFPKGMYYGDYLRYGKMWILGYKSSLQCYVLPAIGIALLYAAYSKRYINVLILLGVSHVVCIFESNGMLLMGLLLIDVVIVIKLYQSNKISRKVLVFAWMGIIASNVIIVFFTDMFLANEAVQYVMYSFLRKNATLSMRTSNWKSVLPAIRENLIWGHGYTWASTRQILYGRETAHAHNLFLELLYEGGLVELFVFSLFNNAVFKRIYKNYKKLSSRVIFYILVVFYIMYIFENVFQKSSSMIWLIFISGYYVIQIDEEMMSQYIIR